MGSLGPTRGVDEANSAPSAMPPTAHFLPPHATHSPLALEPLANCVRPLGDPQYLGARQTEGERPHPKPLKMSEKTEPEGAVTSRGCLSGSRTGVATWKVISTPSHSPSRSPPRPGKPALYKGLGTTRSVAPGTC